MNPRGPASSGGRAKLGKGAAMAQNDIAEATNTYEGFIRWAKIGTVAVALIAAFVVLLIS